MTELKISEDEKVQAGIKNGSIKNFEYLKLNLKDTGVWGLFVFF